MEHLFKECITWKEEIRELWKVGEASGSSRVVGNGLVRMYKGRKGFMLGGTQENSGGVIRPGNTSVRDLLADRRFTGFATDFPSNTGVGRVEAGCL